ncbi:hypothetical protein [Streptomyces aureus]|uniref:Uncharacterized protein n=1 Tax=Streptomyces aureus TaxID=193461 RepID=A0ABV4SKY2_9ACTN
MTTSFVGRDSELAAVGRSLKEHRLVTLTGGGGVGKSRLTLRFAEEVRGAYADGAWWADLSHLYDDRLFTATVSDTVGLLDHNPRAPIEALSEWLAGRRVLLVLACCERVLDACWELVTELLDAAPNLTVLATGRQPLVHGRRGGRFRRGGAPVPRAVRHGRAGRPARLPRGRRDHLPYLPPPRRHPPRGRAGLRTAAREQPRRDRRAADLTPGHPGRRHGLGPSATAPCAPRSAGATNCARRWNASCGPGSPSSTALSTRRTPGPSAPAAPSARTRSPRSWNGSPTSRTPELSEIRDQWEQQARKAAGDNAYDTAYHRALTDDAEHALAHALQGHAGP